MESLDPSFLDYILRTFFPDFEEEMFSWEKLTLPPRRERGRGVRNGKALIGQKKEAGSRSWLQRSTWPGLAGRWQ